MFYNPEHWKSLSREYRSMHNFYIFFAASGYFKRISGKKGNIVSCLSVLRIAVNDLFPPFLICCFIGIYYLHNSLK